MSNTESDWSGRNEGEPTLQQILERPMITEEGEGDGATKVKETSTAPDEPDVVKSYLQEIRKVPLLNAHSEKVLAAAAEDGDESARRHLIEANTRLVVSTSSITAAVSSSRPMPPGGSARRSSAPWPTRRCPSACPSTCTRCAPRPCAPRRP